jgi:hypothetical protein
MTKARDIYRSLKYRFIKPDWVYFPRNIQIDTHNYCNLWQCGTGCIHCNVKPMLNKKDRDKDWNLPRGVMPTEMIEQIITYWSKHGSNSIAPYINGEPCLDERLPYICDFALKHNMFVVIDTNGTVIKNKSFLIHRNLRQVRVTHSAISRETFKLVMGADLYKEAVMNITHFLKHKYENQYPMLYFITNRFNEHELLPFIKKWQGKAHLVIFPIHEVEGIQKKSTGTTQKKGQWAEFTKKITGQYPKQPSRPIDIFMDGRRTVRYFGHYDTCQGTNSFSVAWTGELLHCTDIPYKYNYGHIKDHPDMLSIWRKRNLAKLDHPACKVCNVKSPDHDKILRKYLL